MREISELNLTPPPAYRPDETPESHDTNMDSSQKRPVSGLSTKRASILINAATKATTKRTGFAFAQEPGASIVIDTLEDHKKPATLSRASFSRKQDTVPLETLHHQSAGAGLNCDTSQNIYHDDQLRTQSAQVANRQARRSNLQVHPHSADTPIDFVRLISSAQQSPVLDTSPSSKIRLERMPPTPITVPARTLQVKDGLNSSSRAS